MLCVSMTPTKHMQQLYVLIEADDHYLHQTGILVGPQQTTDGGTSDSTLSNCTSMIRNSVVTKGAVLMTTILLVFGPTGQGPY